MKKIVIVDDNKETRTLVKTTLGQGYTIYEASDGRTAIEAARTHVPDLIIMDIALSDSPIDGIMATRILKQTPDTACCPIIVLTGSERDRRQEAIDAGACDVIRKPFSPLHLIKKLEYLLATV